MKYQSILVFFCFIIAVNLIDLESNLYTKKVKKDNRLVKNKNIVKDPQTTSHVSTFDRKSDKIISHNLNENQFSAEINKNNLDKTEFVPKGYGDTTYIPNVDKFSNYKIIQQKNILI